MTLPHLTLNQRIALQLRLNNRIIVSAMVGGQRKENAIGLAKHRDPVHRCGLCRIDWHSADSKPNTHPYDFISDCPVLYDDPVLQAQINQAIEIEDLGGLSVLGVPLTLLPWRFVNFYQAVLSARDRFLGERDHAQSQLYR